MNEANGKSAGDERIEHAENNAEEKMNIPSIIEPKDMAMDEPDELSVMAFISDSPLRDGEAEGARRGGGAPALGGDAPHAGSHERTMSVPGLDTGDVFLPQTFTIQTKNANGDDITDGGAPF